MSVHRSTWPRRIGVVIVVVTATLMILWSGNSVNRAVAEQSEAAPDSVGVDSQGSIAASSSHACAVAQSGSAYCWGNNWSGELGIGYSGSTHIPTPTVVVGLTGAKAVTVGTQHSCALSDQGAVFCWGNGANGQLGVGNNNSVSSAQAVPALAAGVVDLAAGSFHTCAGTTAGALQCWGNGNDGQIGQGVASRNTPGVVPTLGSGVARVSAGENLTCALLVDGTVKCFGANQYGQTGAVVSSYQNCMGFMMCFTEYTDSPPTTVTGFGNQPAVAISAGDAHACAVLGDGSVACWGKNDVGQLGSAGANTSTARLVTGITNAVAVSAGGDHTCALLSTGATKCWGNNGSGQLGDGTYTARASATDVLGMQSEVTAVSVGRFFSCGVKTDGIVYCWGTNDTMTLGRGRPRFVLEPLPLSSLGSGVTNLAGGGAHTCAVVASGALKCWGDNQNGEVNASGEPLVLLPTEVPGVVSNGVTVTSLGLGFDHTCVGLSDQTAKCWGNGAYGALGRGDFVSSATPMSPTLAGGVQVSKVYAHGEQSCLITSTGAAMCWGANWYGQLGVGDTNNRNVPTAVLGLNGLTVVDIAMGYWHTCFMYTDGVIQGHGVKCVGNNIIGMLGIGGVAQETTPQQVTNLTSGVSAIVAGRWHTCALMTDKTVKCWGNNDAGELGNGGNAAADRTSPDPVPNLMNVEKLVVGERHTCALLTSGSVSCWGANGNGQLGVGDANERRSPTAVSAWSSGVTVLGAGGLDSAWATTCVVKDGTVYCTGSDERAQIALGYVARSPVPAATAGGLLVSVPAPPQQQQPAPIVFIPPPTVPPTTTLPPPTSTAPREISPELIEATPTTNLGAPIAVIAGQSVVFQQSGFEPGALVDAYIASSPRLLGRFKADQQGVVKFDVVIPGEMRGEHSIVVFEPSSGRIARQSVSVKAPVLPVTGSGSLATLVPWIFLVFATGIIALVARRRLRPID